MSDETLFVGPDALRRSAAALSGHYEDMRRALAGVNSNHSDLRQTWTGAASEAVSARWDDLHPRLAAHVDTLADHAQRLNDGADLYTGQESANAALFDS